MILNILSKLIQVKLLCGVTSVLMNSSDNNTNNHSPSDNQININIYIYTTKYIHAY